MIALAFLLGWLCGLLTYRRYFIALVRAEGRVKAWVIRMLKGERG